MTDKQMSPSQTPEARRKRYQHDAEYRDRAIQSTRRSYRDRHGRQDESTCLSNLVNLEGMGTVRGVKIGGRTYQRVTFTVEELAFAVNRRVEVVYRWIRKDMFPKPTSHTDDLPNQHSKVYRLKEAEALVYVMGEHQKATPYYRQDHSDTKVWLFVEFVKAK
jgi:hypothetical protein